MSSHRIEAGVRVTHLLGSVRVAEHQPQHFQDQAVLEEGVGAEVVVGAVLVDFVVHQLVTQTVHGKPAQHPCLELVVYYVPIRDVVLEFSVGGHVCRGVLLSRVVRFMVSRSECSYLAQ